MPQDRSKFDKLAKQKVCSALFKQGRIKLQGKEIGIKTVANIYKKIREKIRMVIGKNALLGFKALKKDNKR